MNNAETVFAAAHRLQASGTPYALVSVIRALPPASARPGDKAVVTADGTLHGWVGGGCAQPAVIRTVRQALADGRAQLIRVSPREAPPRDTAAAADLSSDALGDVLEFGMSCHSGGTLELFVDPVLPRATLVVIGDSPVARSLCQLAPHVGFAVTHVAHAVVDAAATAASDAVETVNGNGTQRLIASDDLAVAVPQIAPGAWVVVATQGRRDVQALRLALALQARQVAFVASARKAAVLKASLVAAGSEAAAVAAIVAPAGYPIAASTPEEIALSVLAAVVAHRRGAGSEVTLVSQADAQPRVAGSSAPPGLACCEPAVAADSVGASATSATQPAAAVKSCCGGAMADLPPLPAVAPARTATAFPAAAASAVAASLPPPSSSSSSCCGG